MRYLKFIPLLSAVLVFFAEMAEPSSEYRIECELREGGRINSILCGGNNGETFIGTDNGLYKMLSPGCGEKGKPVPEGYHSRVRSLVFYGGSLCGLDRDGLFIKGKGDLRKPSFFKKGLTGLCVYEKNGVPSLTLCDGKKLYTYNEGVLEPLVRIPSGGTVFELASFGQGILAAKPGGLYFYSPGEKVIKEVLSFPSAVPGEGGGDKKGASLSGEDRIIDIDVNGKKAAVLALSGVFIIGPENMRAYLAAGNEGIDTAGGNILMLKGGGIAVSDTQALFIRYPGDIRWQRKALDGMPQDISAMEETGDGHHIYIGKGSRVLSFDLRGLQPGIIRSRDGLFRPACESISVSDVQDMAVDYADLRPEKIKKWKAAARIKAILPKLSLSFSESSDGNIEIYKSASRHYVIDGPEEIDRDWRIDLSWDLSDIIWNDAQTSIDVRSKLMVQLRNDILEEITRLYFERKRLMADIIKDRRDGAPEEDAISEKMIRIREINGYIDALTGGNFSRRLEKELTG